MKLKTLTPHEIESLQVDAALRLIGTNSTILCDLNQQIGQAIIEKGKADIKLQQLKNDKQTVIEFNRSLKVIVECG